MIPLPAGGRLPREQFSDRWQDVVFIKILGSRDELALFGQDLHVSKRLAFEFSYQLVKLDQAFQSCELVIVDEAFQVDTLIHASPFRFEVLRGAETRPDFHVDHPSYLSSCPLLEACQHRRRRFLSRYTTPLSPARPLLDAPDPFAAYLPSLQPQL